jgi:hypothetical protein
MPINAKYIEPFVENEFMHIYCKAAGNNILFRNDENRLWFLKNTQLIPTVISKHTVIHYPYN